MVRQVANSIIIALLAALLGYSWAQGPQLRGADEAKPADFPIAVVNLGKVFNAYKPLVEKRGEHQRAMQKVEEAGKSRVAELKELQDELKQAKPGSEEQRQLNETLQAKGREFEAFRREQQQALLESESKIYVWAYERISEQIAQYAEARGLKLVLQHQASPLEGSNPQQQIAGLNRQVIYQNALDITDEILQIVN